MSGAFEKKHKSPELLGSQEELARRWEGGSCDALRSVPGSKCCFAVLTATKSR